MSPKQSGPGVGLISLRLASRRPLLQALGSLPDCEPDPQALANTSPEWQRNLKHEEVPSRPGAFHPEPLTDPDMNLSIHPARAIARRLPPSIDYRVPPVAG